MDIGAPWITVRLPIGDQNGGEVAGGQVFEPEDFGIGNLFDRIRDAVIVANAADECIVLWNPAAEALFGYSRQEALELPLHCLVPPALRDRHRAGIANYQQTGTGELIDSNTPLELSGLHKDGREVPVELTLSPIGEKEGDRFVLAILRDMTDRRSAEQMRLELQRSELKRRHALDINDNVVQGLALAKFALELGETERAVKAVASTLAAAQHIMTDLFAETGEESAFEPGSLRRSTPARTESEDELR